MSERNHSRKPLHKRAAWRLLCAITTALILISAAACSHTQKDQPDDTTDPPTVTIADTTTAATEQPTAAEQTTIPESQTTAAPATTAVPATTAAPETTTAAPVTATEAPSAAAPAAKGDIIAFFAAAVNDIKNNGSAGYDKVEYQKIHDVNMTGNGTVDGMIRDSIGSFAKDETTAEHLIAEKGSPAARENMLGWNLTDDSAVVSAELQEEGGNYRITILMADEDTPGRSGQGHLEAVGSVMYVEDVENALKSVPQMNEFSDIHILYTGYTVTAVISPEGRLVSLKHHCSEEIRLGHMKILILSLDNKSISLENTVEYTGFVY